MTVLITGGAGFIGSNLVRACLQKGYKVRVIDNLSNGRLGNIKDLLKKIKFVEADINNKEALMKIMNGVDIVFHLAALNAVPRSTAYPFMVHEANATGTLNVLLAAKELGVKRVIYSSSSSTYGVSETYPVREDFALRPISNYAVSKLTGELYCHVFHRLYGLETICLKYFNVFGPYQNPHLTYAAAIPKFIKAALNDEPIVIHGDGTQARDFTYVKNVLEANLKALRAPKSVCGKVFNVAGGKPVSLMEIIKLIEEILGRPVKINFQPVRDGDLEYSSADMTLAKKHLKFEPKHSFEKGLRETIEWHKNYSWEE